MAGPPDPPPKPPPGPPRVPPPTPPRVPADEAPATERRLQRWLIVTLLIALLAAGGAGYAISEIENTKDENREGNAAANALRADVEVFREQATERLDTLENRLDDSADATAVRRLENELDAVDRRVGRLDREGDQGGTQQLETRVDELETRVEELEEDSN